MLRKQATMLGSAGHTLRLPPLLLLLPLALTLLLTFVLPTPCLAQHDTVHNTQDDLIPKPNVRLSTRNTQTRCSSNSHINSGHALPTQRVAPVVLSPTQRNRALHSPQTLPFACVYVRGACGCVHHKGGPRISLPLPTTTTRTSALFSPFIRSRDRPSAAPFNQVATASMYISS